MPGPKRVHGLNAATINAKVPDPINPFETEPVRSIKTIPTIVGDNNRISKTVPKLIINFIGNHSKPGALLGGPC